MRSVTAADGLGMADESTETSPALLGVILDTACFCSSPFVDQCRWIKVVKTYRRCQGGCVPRKYCLHRGRVITDKQEKGYEPEAVLNFLALMGWDHHAVRPSTSLEHPRNDNNSLSELFTMEELIQAFDIKHINHRKAAVDMQKLDFLNKMTLRHKAGRLGDDGNMTEVSSGHEGSRKEMVERLQEKLRGVKVLQGR